MAEDGGADTQVTDAAAIEEAAEAIEVVPTELLRGAWLQWSNQGTFFVMAESELEVPLVIEVYVDELRQTVVSNPVRPIFDPDLLLVPEEIAGWMHEIEVTDVDPGESFEVLVVNDGSWLSGSIPEAGQPMTMVVMGDNRTQDDRHAEVVEAILAEEPVLFVNTGDMLDFGGNLSDWDRFFEIESELMSHSFFFYTMGNHEVLGQPYLDAFFHTEDTYDVERNWVARVGDVAMVALSLYDTDWTDEEPLEWLDGQLETLRDEASWLFVLFHHPLYTFSNHDPWEEGRDSIQPLFEEHGVDIVFSGHNHCYEHFNVNGIDYVVTGGGGAPLYGIHDGPEGERDLLIQSLEFYHFIRLDVTEDELIVSVIAAEDGDLFETWTLTAQ
jgi:hypothetical protein